MCTVRSGGVHCEEWVVCTVRSGGVHCEEWWYALETCKYFIAKHPNVKAQSKWRCSCPAHSHMYVCVVFHTSSVQPAVKQCMTETVVGTCVMCKWDGLHTHIMLHISMYGSFVENIEN